MIDLNLSLSKQEKESVPVLPSSIPIPPLSPIYIPPIPIQLFYITPFTTPPVSITPLATLPVSTTPLATPPVSTIPLASPPVSITPLTTPPVPILPRPIQPFPDVESVMLSPGTTINFGANMLSLSDQRLLAKRSDYSALDDSMCLSVQAASSLSNLGHRFRAKIRENESLYAEIASLRKELQESEKKVRSLRKETKYQSKLISKYQTEMKNKLDALQVSGRRLEAEQRMLSFGIPDMSSSKS